jgi:RHS repeat-associated protein
LLATYFYDLHGQRSRKQTTAAAPQGAATVVYHYDDAGQLLAETTASGAPLITYAWRDATPVSLIVHGTGTGGATTARVLYLEADHLGSPIAARNQAGRLLWKWELDAFGSTVPNEDPDADGQKTTINLRFPGQYFDAESALHYNWHRYYDPKLGRYISSDPIGVEGGLNTYQYVEANPLSFTDPTGLLFMTTIGGLQRGTTLDQAVNMGMPGTIAAGLGVGVIATGVTVGAIGSVGAGIAGAGAAAICTPTGRAVTASLLQLLGNGQKAGGLAIPQGMASTIPTSTSALNAATRQLTSAANQAAKNNPKIGRPTLPMN